jgi:hypothetical protein
MMQDFADVCTALDCLVADLYQSLAQRSEHTSAKPKACPSPDPDHMNAHDRVCGFVRDTTMSQSRVAQ